MARTEKDGRRGRGDGGLSQRTDGLWVGTVDLGWLDGKRIRKSVSSKTKSGAAKKLTDLKAEIARGNIVPGASMTVKTWLNHWLDTIASARNAPRTLENYRSVLDTWLIPNLGDYQLDKLNESHIRALYLKMKRAGRADSTRRGVHSVLHRALVVAKQERRVPYNVADNVDAPPTGVIHRTPLTLAQARMVLDHLDSEPQAARWVAALMLGMRQGECLGLRWEDIDVEAGVIHVRNELQRLKGEGLVLRHKLKTDKSQRTLPMIAPMAYALARTEHRGEYVFWGAAKDPRDDYQAWKDLLIRLGLFAAGTGNSDMPELAAARTTTSTLLRDAGVPDTVNRDILGHATVMMNQESYQRTDADTMKAAMAQLAQSVGGQGQPELVEVVHQD